MKTPIPMDHDVVEKTKHGMVTMLKATDPVVKFIRRQTKAVNYDPNPGRTKLILGFKVGIPVFISGLAAGISWMMRRRRSS
jgi:hypothetical protein